MNPTAAIDLRQGEEHRIESRFRIDVDYADRVNFAMQQCGVPLVQRVSLTNSSDAPAEAVCVTISLQNGECEAWVGRIEKIDPGYTYHIEPDRLVLKPAQLATRTEAERTLLEVKAECDGEAKSELLPVDLLAFDQWPGTRLYPELLAAFCTPNHPKVAEFLHAARGALRHIGVGDALDGYQSGSRLRAAQLAEACFNSVLARGFGYINPPASFDQDGQRVRLVDRICREGLGSCLDLSLLLASLWEQAGLHPLVLLLEGHAMPAVWTHEANLPEPAIDEPARIRNLIELGEIVPVESTFVTQLGARFQMAVDAAKRKLAAPGAGFCAIDIRTCRKKGVRPLPLRSDGNVSEVDLSALAPSESLLPDARLDKVALADRAESHGARPLSVEPIETGEQRIARWKSRLLDLSLRNRLVNFRHTKQTIRFNVPDVATLEDMLASESRFSIFPRSDGDEEFLRSELQDRHLFTTETPAETQSRLLALYRTARSSIEETGANLLHLAIGMLKWFETPTSDTPRYAPLILLPARLTRFSTAGGYRYELSLSEEPLRPNVTLLEKLRTDFAINTAELGDLPEDERGLDVPLILRRFRAAIRDSARWEVEESVVLGLFSFNKFLMWRDLQEHVDRLRENRLVRHLVDRAQDEFDAEPLPSPDALDDEVAPGDLLCTRDADSSQLAAVRAAAHARTFVLEGPPGTGKSQTIANIIANSLANGKRVLFVAEKMAALSVVSRRLREDGLGPFCLELHSAKASKKEVLVQLKEALDAAPLDEPQDWAALCNDLGLTRSQLNTYVRELHARRTSGESLYRVLGRLTFLGDGHAASPATTDIASTTESQLLKWRQTINVLAESAASIDPPHEHPLRGIGRAEWNFALPQEARTALESARGAINALQSALREFVSEIVCESSPSAFSRDSVESLVAIASHFLQSAVPSERILAGAEAESVLQQLEQLNDLGRKRDELKRGLVARYREEILNLDHLVHIDELKRALDSFTPLNHISTFFARRKLRRFCLGRLPDTSTLIADLEKARELKTITNNLASSPIGSAVLGAAWNGGDPDWAQVKALIEWCRAVRKYIAVLRKDSSTPPILPSIISAACNQDVRERSKNSAKRLLKAWNAWVEQWQRVKDLLVTSSSAAFGKGKQNEWLPTVEAVLNRWNGALADLNDWCAWQRARSAAIANGLAELVERFESGDLKRTEIFPAFERGYGRAWFTAVANSIPAIREFNAGTHEKAIAHFRAIDRAFIQRTRQAVAARLKQKSPRTGSQVSAQSEVGILKRELEKRSRHLPTRRLIECIPNLLARLKPCFLMSPLSVAQYLDAKLPPFDLVVFDEASQIPVWDSIGAIARGKEVIVVGDSKQLPPTTFFTRVDGEDDPPLEDIAMEDLESILKECNASGIPAMRLAWHYRSRHETLIAFSNHHYYENTLHTFPSPLDRSEALGVTMRCLPDAIYDRGGTRTNRVEAERVVDEVVKLLTSSETPDSIGIVTFNIAQQSLIEDLLDAKRRAIPQIEPFFSEASEPVFVKNLENVQGDERDTIIFSVGYGPDSFGKYSMNFGPLNADGGERRLNVAITRARKRLLVFSSIRSDHIDLKRTNALGVKHFKAFLDYAERGPRALAEVIQIRKSEDFESGFERAVCNALIARGYEVDTQVGCAGYRIDLAVRHPDQPGRYVIGIECDGAAYHSAHTARDRDRLRQTVLENLGWRIERIWSTDWWINPQRSIDRIIRAVEDARHRSADVLGLTSESAASPTTSVALAAPASSSTSTEIEVLPGGLQSEPRMYASGPATAPPPRASDVKESVAKPYMAASAPAAARRIDVFDAYAASAAVDMLCQIVEKEAPIVEELALRRLAEWHGIERVTDRFRRRFSELLADAIRSNRITIVGGAIWSFDVDPQSYAAFRTAGSDVRSQRDITHIPLIERANAVIHVLQEQFGLPRVDLEREVAAMLGYQRVTDRIRESIADAVDELLRQGRIRMDGTRVCLPL